jgi:endonuclease YncB( thermonuclease family)
MADIRPFLPKHRRGRRWTRPEDYAAPGRRLWSRLMIVLPLAVFGAVFALGLPEGWALPSIAPAAPDREAAAFAACDGPVRVSCVVDGDTFWYRGAKIRLADINTPETSEPRCAAEARLGAQATRRLTALLNAGPFTLEPNSDGTGRDSDRYGRLLRVVTRDGESHGAVLVDAGLAEHWQGHRGSWC